MKSRPLIIYFFFIVILISVKSWTFEDASSEIKDMRDDFGTEEKKSDEQIFRNIREGYEKENVDDDSVCFNNCNSHGKCKDFTCYCQPGWHGDDCSHTYAEPTANGDIVPLLGAGHFNVTSRTHFFDTVIGDSHGNEHQIEEKQFATFRTKGINVLTLVGFSSSQCHRCIVVEKEYEKVTKVLTRWANKVLADGVGSSAKSLGKGKHGLLSLLPPVVQFIRGDTSASSSLKTVALEYGASDLPSLVFIPNTRGRNAKSKGKHKVDTTGHLYRGVHNARDILDFIRKVTAPEPLVRLQSLIDVHSFLVKQTVSNYTISEDDEVTPVDPLDIGYLGETHSIARTVILGFFSSPHDLEEDDYNDFSETALALQAKEELFFAAVTNKHVITWFKKNKLIDRTPSVLLYTDAKAFNPNLMRLAAPSASTSPGAKGSSLAEAADSDSAREILENAQYYKTVNLDEIGAGESLSLKTWIAASSVPLVGKLTATNFALYDKVGKPMLMLFLNLEHEHRVTSPGQYIGGKTGGLLNQVLLDELAEVAKEHSDKLSCVYLDGNKHEAQMRSVGLYGGAARLPSIAFNTRDGSKIPFPEELPINKDTLMQYVADFLSGKLRNVDDAQDMAKKALQSAKPINPRNRAVRSQPKPKAEVVRGVSEEYADGSAGDKAIWSNITADNFDQLLMQGENEMKDVVLMLHADTGSCPSCGHFAVYFKKMAERFNDLQIPSLIIARMDVSNQTPPAYLHLMPESELPVVVMLPAHNRLPPWNYFSGIGKVGPLMKWVHQMCAIPFALPNLPHLDDSQKDLYKQQVKQREIQLAEKRKKDDENMAAQDALREAIISRDSAATHEPQETVPNYEKTQEYVAADVKVDPNSKRETDLATAVKPPKLIPSPKRKTQPSTLKGKAALSDDVTNEHSVLQAIETHKYERDTAPEAVLESSDDPRVQEAYQLWNSMHPAEKAAHFRAQEELDIATAKAMGILGTSNAARKSPKSAQSKHDDPLDDDDQPLDSQSATQDRSTSTNADAMQGRSTAANSRSASRLPTKMRGQDNSIPTQLHREGNLDSRTQDVLLKQREDLEFERRAEEARKMKQRRFEEAQEARFTAERRRRDLEAEYDLREALRRATETDRRADSQEVEQGVSPSTSTKSIGSKSNAATGTGTSKGPTLDEPGTSARATDEHTATKAHEKKRKANQDASYDDYQDDGDAFKYEF